MPTWRFYDFHVGWLVALRAALNRGVLPAGYVAHAEQRAAVYGPDVLALTALPRPDPPAGGVVLAEPRTDRRAVLWAAAVPTRAVAVRHASDRRVVAVIEVVSRANKDRPATVRDFAGKAAGLLRAGVHVTVLDLLPAGLHDPGGLHAAVCDALGADADGDDPPPPPARLLASYRADPPPLTAFLQVAAVGRPLPDVPLFLDGGAFVHIPTEVTYLAAVADLDADTRAALTAATAPPE
jgi:hypothetical protein